MKKTATSGGAASSLTGADGNGGVAIQATIHEEIGLANRQINILLVEDRDDHASLIKVLLDSGLEDAEVSLEHATNGPDGLKRLERGAYDICLLDYEVGGDMTGLDVLRRAVELGHTTPAILMTAVGDEGVAVEAMKSGAKDYLRKEALSPELLRSAIWHALELHREELLRREAQEEVQLAKDELEDKVEELANANEHLIRLDRLKDEFVSSISHELRTPITNLKLGHHLLLANPDERNKYMATLRRETERLHFIIEELLLVARMAHQPAELSLTKVDLNALALLYVADRALLAEERGLTLTYKGEPDLLKVTADRMQLERVLGILVLNALNYTPPGGEVTVTTSSMHSDAKAKSDEVWVGFSVSDDGPGIPSDEQERLYERFFRGKIATRAGVPGTGLGLSIARDIVDQHGGTIEFDGENGKGTTFRVWLPAIT